jgi:hypothetical protein
MKRKLLTERQLLRRICGPTKERGGTWRNTINDELTLNLLTTTTVAPPSNVSKWQMGFNSAFKGLNDLIRNKNIFKLQYSPKIKLACHVHRMTIDRMDDNSMSGNRYIQDWQEEKIGWENDIKEDIRIMKINNWTKCVQDRVKWKEVFENDEPFRQ